MAGRQRVQRRSPRPWVGRAQGSVLSSVAGLAIIGVAALHFSGCAARVSPLAVSFSAPTPQVQAFDFAEVTASVSWPRPTNPFTDASLTGWFEAADGRSKWNVEGFADAENGSVFRIRFVPPAAGDYRYHVDYRQGSAHRSADGTFHAVAGTNKGPIRVDRAYPWHFVWEGTGEHYFFSGTTAYWLFGWQSDSVIDASLERLHRLKVNRVRVTIAGRSDTFFGEPVTVGPRWTLYATAWPAKHPLDVYDPGFDYRRFDIAYWQKIERGLRFARERGMIISLVLDMNDARTHVAAGSDDEKRYIRYAIARLGAFSNVTWDLGDDLDGFRDAAWSEATGRFIQHWDPYHHLTTSHPRDGDASVRQARRSDWVGFTSFQNWTRHQHSFMLEQRKLQQKIGLIIPQTNEEYGYEDHYPIWALPPNADAPDVLRRMAWEISMAGGYQITGETAKRGTNIWPNTGGGWMNGRGDSTMTMLEGYGHMADFFTSFDWWRTDPHDELVTAGAYCLANAGATYVVYLPHGEPTTVRLEAGEYKARGFDPLSGEWHQMPAVNGSSWTTPSAPTRGNDWVILLERIQP